MQLLTILLQAADIAVDGMPWQRLFDLALSLGILGVIAKVLWGRQKQLEDRLTSYIEQDRKEMLEVIKHNTAAFNKLNDNIDRLTP